MQAEEERERERERERAGGSERGEDTHTCSIYTYTEIYIYIYKSFSLDSGLITLDSGLTVAGLLDQLLPFFFFLPRLHRCARLVCGAGVLVAIGLWCGSSGIFVVWILLWRSWMKKYAGLGKLGGHVTTAFTINSILIRQCSNIMDTR